MPVDTKRLGLAVAALILAATCTFVIVALLMPADSVRDAVKAEIRAVTGLEPVVRGGVSVSLFPSGRVSLEDVTLGDNRTGAPAIFSAPDRANRDRGHTAGASYHYCGPGPRSELELVRSPRSLGPQPAA